MFTMIVLSVYYAYNMMVLLLNHNADIFIGSYSEGSILSYAIDHNLLLMTL